MTDYVLLIDDNEDVYSLVKEAISLLAPVKWLSSIHDAKEFFKTIEAEPSLVLLDIKLPDGDGIEYCGQLTIQHPAVPIFILSGLHDISYKVMAFSAGADDYIQKPFSMLELRARVDSKIKKHRMQVSIGEDVRFLDIELSPKTQTLSVHKRGGSLAKEHLTKIEFGILKLLMSRPTEYFSRDEILSEVWGDDIFIQNRSIDTHLHHLRKKLDGSAATIETLRGIGYRICRSGFNKESDNFLSI